MKGKIVTLLIFIILIVILGGLCFGYYKKQTLNINNPIVTMEVEDYGTIKIELYPDKAPNTVKNFIALVNNKFYDGLKFHRVVKDFMIQGGDHEGNGSGDALIKYFKGNDDETKYAIEGEFIANGYSGNDLNLTEGIIAMARGDYTSHSPTLTTESYNSGGTQFFIMTSNNYTSISGNYAGFDKVIEGMDVVKKIAEVEVITKTEYEKQNSEEKEDKKENEESNTAQENAETPKKDVKIKSVTVDTFGVDYGYPKTIEPFNYTKWIYNMYGIPYNE